MNLRDLARLLIKIAGILIIINAINTLPLLMSAALYWQQGGTSGALITATFGPAAVSLSAGILMFWLSGPIVDRALVRPSPDEISGTGSLQGFEELAIAMIGIYILVDGVADVVHTLSRAKLYYLLAERNLRTPPPALTPQDFAAFCSAFFRSGIGFLMFTCPHGLAGARKWLGSTTLPEKARRKFLGLRSAGLTKPSDE